MREQIEAQHPFFVEFYLDVYVSHDTVVAGDVILPVAYIAVYYHPVVEQLGRNGHIEHVRTAARLLVVHSEIQRDIQFLEYGTQLPGKDFRNIGKQQRRIVHDARLLVWNETVGYHQ